MAAETDNVESKVLNCMLTEIDSDSIAPDAQICVICLERVSEGASTRPCGHSNFDFLCLLSWLEEQNFCPLCKTEVLEVDYNGENGEARRYVVPTHSRNAGAGQQASSSSFGNQLAFSGPPRPRPRPRHQRHEWRGRRHRSPVSSSSSSPDTALLRRRRIYKYQLYSLHVGTNRISAYSDLGPEDFTRSPALVSRARTWIRRELRVFTYLGGGGSSPARSEQNGSSGSFDRYKPSMQSASNAEFLLEYIVAILKSVDIKASTGHAEDLVAEFLGRENAKLFLHELNSWLRSPYESLEAWDNHVQYPEPTGRDEATSQGPDHRQRKRPFDGIREASHPSGVSREVNNSYRGSKRRMIDRYVPD